MRSLIIIGFLFITICPADAGVVLSMEEAERLLLENNPAIRSLKLELQKGDASIADAGALPNPVVNYSLESVRNGETEKEETWSLTQNLDMSGRRAERIAAASKHKEAAVLFHGYRVSEILLQMRQSYCRILFLAENEKALSGIARAFSEVERKIAARVSAGDVSESDLMKVTGERNKIARGLEALRTEMKSEKAGLALLLDMQDTNFDLSGDLAGSPKTFQSMLSTELYLENRPDVAAQGKTVEATEASVSASRREALPTIDLEAGYKKRTGGFSGFVVGLSLPLPLFDRNHGAIAHAEAELQQQKILLDSMKKAAQAEVNLLLDRIASLESRVADISKNLETSQELTSIARIAYEEGETGILELLEASRNEKELVIERNTALYERQVSLYQLERALGRRLTYIGGKQ